MADKEKDKYCTLTIENRVTKNGNSVVITDDDGKTVTIPDGKVEVKGDTVVVNGSGVEVENGTLTIHGEAE
ncbi:MAG: hypothetical protein J1D88_09685 [Treponema sp.]|nr:hypothetical protein [Treponema sp.]